MTVIDTIRSHRSIRKYKPDPVPDNLLEEILNAGIRASSSGNMQVYSIIVTRDRELRERLYKPHRQQSMVLDAPVLLTFCADFHRMKSWLRLSDAPDNFDNFMSFMIAAIDAILVSQNVALAAESRGLGICYLGSTLANCDQVGSILGLPDNVVPVVGFTLGYPDEDPDLRDRLPFDGLVHYETYHDYTDERIHEIYEQRDTKGWERYMSSARLRNMVEESSVENLAQIYTVLKYTRASHQRHSQTVLDFLTRQQFMPVDDGDNPKTELFSSILDSIGEPILFADTEHKTIYMNEAAIAHYSGGEDLLGRSLLDCHNPESQQVMQDVLAEMQAGDLEESLISENEERLVYMRPVRDENGDLLGYYERYEKKSA
ncbi:MAG: nitroreductase family protein [Chloroflexota bacterium]|nr:nitroreductase family protein [Chloroflexota bacterium]